jgi:hypothetical protein
MSNTTSETKLGGRFTFPGTSLPVQRIGYGAMQLAGPGVWGRPRIWTVQSPSFERPSRPA